MLLRNIAGAIAAVASLLASTILAAAPQTFEQAKVELRQYVYADRNQAAEGTLYCGCHWAWTGRSGGRINFSSCGMRPRAQSHRAERIEWEHVVPASLMGQQRQCWQEGGRANCTATDSAFQVMEADMHNLAPSVGELNADRSNFRFGALPAARYQHGACDFKVDFPGRVVEPRDEVKGRIARIYFYIHDRYDLRMSEQQQRLFMAWDRQFPVSAWETERDRRIATRMGHNNPFVTGERIWTSGHQNARDGIVSPAPKPGAKTVQNSHPTSAQSGSDTAVRANRNSRVYHLPEGCPSYNDVSARNIVEFASESAAQAAGYRKARNCKSD
jgi:deoxyribonuclease-1